MKKVLFLLLTFFKVYSSDVCPTLCCKESFSFCPYGKGVLGEGLGFDHSYGTAGVFTSYNSYNCLQTFLDFRFHFLHDHESALNAGVGLRYLGSGCCPALYGINFYYDYRTRCIGNFNQVGGGFEYFCGCGEFRFNCYFPIRDKHCCPINVFDDYEGDFFVKCQQRELSYRGVDAEIVGNAYRDCVWNIYAGAGPYHFWNCCGENLTGARARLGLRFSQFVAIEIVGSYDNFFKGKYAGRLTICLPFDRMCPKRTDWLPNYVNSACNGCGPFIFRNELILIREGCCWDFNYDDS